MSRSSLASSRSCPRCVIKYLMSVFRLLGQAAEDFRNRASATADSPSELPGAVFGLGSALGFEGTADGATVDGFGGAQKLSMAKSSQRPIRLCLVCRCSM